MVHNTIENSILVLEVFRHGQWTRYGSQTYSDIDTITKAFTIAEKMVFEIKGVVQLRVAEYRNYYFIEPYDIKLQTNKE